MAAPFLSEHWHRVGKLRPRLRAHVPVVRQRARGRTWYVIQDTATGRFHRFTPAVYLVIGSMNGRRSVDEIWQAAIARLGDEAPSQSEIVDLLAQLHDADLILTDVDADAAELFARHQKQGRARWKSRFGNPLAIRVPLVNPDRFLGWTAPLAKPFFGWFGLALWLGLVGYALVLSGIHWRPLTENLADKVMGLDNIVLMAAIFPVLKLLHELAHGYACKLGGGQVREMGLMFLILAPVPYVDASASTAFRSRRQRILVAAAGMLAEVMIAALAMLVWTRVEPGLVRTIAFNVMIIAGLSTVLFNINPLMRLDGYYILSDLIDIPNLGQRATKLWADIAERRLLGSPAEPMETEPGEKPWLFAYAPVSLAYRLVIMLGIALFVAQHFFIIGILLALLSVATTLIWPLFKSARHVITSPKFAENRRRAVGVAFGGAAVIAGLIGLVPVPLSTLAEGVVWLPESAILRIAEDGFVERVAARSGERVEPGALILEANEPDLASEAVVTASQIEALTIRFDAEWVGERVKAELTRTELSLKQETLASQQARLERLTLRAGEAGRLSLPHEADLAGRFLKRGEVVGFVLPERSRLLRVAVAQADVDLVRQRLRAAEAVLSGRVGEPLAASVLREVPAASNQLPSRALSIEGGGRIAVDTRDPKNARTLEGIFLFDILLPDTAPSGNFGARAFVRFDHGNEPLARQWWRRLRQLVLSQLEA